MYKLLCVGGTFDVIHAGHEALLTQAFDAGEHVLVGVTTNAYVKAHKRRVTQAYTERKHALDAWLSARDAYRGRYAIIPLNDPFGPAVKDAQLEAIVVSEETRKRAEEANALRKKAGLPALDVLVVPMRKAEDNTPISSTRIREGKISVWGKLMLPDGLRGELAQPLGIIRTRSQILASFQAHRSDTIITVGDLTTKTILSEGITPALMVVDHRVGRRPYTALKPLIEEHAFKRIAVASGPGYISQEAVLAITESLEHPEGSHTIIEVDGEEDLLALIAIREAPLGSVVYYGQPKIAAWACGPEISGIVEVTVTHEKQTQVIALLKQFVGE